MNRLTRSYSRFSCSFEDGRSEDVVIPNSLLEGSQTGGREEISDFVNRLETARTIIDGLPEFKAFFAEQYHPLVLDLAYRYITLTAGKYLIEKLETADAQVLEQIESSSGKYPFATVKRDLECIKIRLIAEATSAPQMVAAVRRNVGPGLEILCSKDDAASCGMTNILAWTLQDFCSHDFSELVLDLGLEKAEAVIWERLWGGDEFPERFAEAIQFHAADLAHEALEIIDLENRQIEWIEALLGRRSSRYYLEIASEAKRSNNPILNWATTQYAGLPASAALGVSETLRAKMWREFKDERARRRFVFHEARRKNQELDLMVLGCAAPRGLLHYSADAWHHCGLHALAAGRGFIVPEVSEFPTPLPDDSGINASEILLGFKEALNASGLTLDAQRVAYARLQDYTREEAHIPFEIPKKRAAAAWKELNRKKNKFVKMLSPSQPPNCTLQ